MTPGNADADFRSFLNFGSLGAGKACIDVLQGLVKSSWKGLAVAVSAGDRRPSQIREEEMI
jgi:hypothetical protein